MTAVCHKSLIMLPDEIPSIIKLLGSYFSLLFLQSKPERKKKAKLKFTVFWDLHVQHT